MKKSLLSLSLVALAIPQMFAYEPDSHSQISGISPDPGRFERVTPIEGIGGMTFRFNNPISEANRNENVYGYIMYDNKVTAMVSSANPKLVNFDSTISDVWQVSFFTNNRFYRPAGDYTVILDEGFFLLGEEKTPSERIVVNYTLTGFPIETSPQDDSIVKSFDEVTITYTQYESVEWNEDMPIEIFDLYGKESPTGGMVVYTPGVEIEGNKVTLFLDVPIKSAGTWKVAASEGTFTLIDAAGNKVSSPELNLQYIIKETLSGIPTPNPAPGVVSTFPGVITLDVPGEATVQTVNGMCGVRLYMVNEDGSLGQQIARYQATLNKENKHQILLTNLEGADVEVAPGNGKYSLQFGEKLYRLSTSTAYISSFSFDYEVVNDKIKYTFTPSDDAYVASVGDITIDFPEAKEVKFISWNYASLNNSLISFAFTPASITGNTVKYNAVCPVDLAGVYTFTTPANQISVDGVVVALSTKVNIGESGVKEVTELPEVFTIYSIDGRIVKINATAQDLSRLARGIYIAGGKKICIK